MKTPVLGYESSYLATVDGEIISKKTGTVMSPFRDCHGYLRITLSKNGKKKNHYVHRLVYEAFHGPIPEGLEVDHKDNTMINNKPSNFRLLTRQQNMRKVHDKDYRKLMSV